MTMMGVSAAFWPVYIVTLDRQFVLDLLEQGQRIVNRVFGGLLIYRNPGGRAGALDRFCRPQ